MIVDGQPGLGKTSTVNWWAVRNECIYLRAKRMDTAMDDARPYYSF